MPDLLDFSIGNGNAAVSPVLAAVDCPDPAKAISQSVNHDIAAGRDAACRRLRHVILVRIGHMQSEVKVTIGFSAINRIKSFRCTMIAFFALGANWLAAESDSILLQRGALAKQRQLACTLVDNDAIRLCFDC